MSIAHLYLSASTVCAIADSFSPSSLSAGGGRRLWRRQPNLAPPRGGAAAVRLRQQTGEGARSPASFSANRQRFHRKLATLQWIDYSPSTFNPDARQPVSAGRHRGRPESTGSHGFPPQRWGFAHTAARPAPAATRCRQSHASWVSRA